MKTSKESIFNNAHLIIMAFTLLITTIGWGAKVSPISQEKTHTWFGYVPMNIQPSMATEHHIPAPLNHKNLAKSENVQVPA